MTPSFSKFLGYVRRRQQKLQYFIAFFGRFGIFLVEGRNQVFFEEGRLPGTEGKICLQATTEFFQMLLAADPDLLFAAGFTGLTKFMVIIGSHAIHPLIEVVDLVAVLVVGEVKLRLFEFQQEITFVQEADTLGLALVQIEHARILVPDCAEWEQAPVADGGKIDRADSIGPRLMVVLLHAGGGRNIM